jgi:hypothetical protein
MGVEVNTEGATLDDGEPRPCGNIGKTVWYGIVARGDTTIVVRTENSDFDAAIAVYEQTGVSPPPGSIDEIACAVSNDGEEPSLSFEAEANQVYWIQAGGRNGAGGNTIVWADCEPQPCPPENDSYYWNNYFIDAPGSMPFTLELDTSTATTEDGEPRSCGNMGKTVWFRLFTSLGSMPIVIDTSGSDYDASVAVYSSPYELPIDQLDSTRIACGDSHVSFDSRQNDEVFIQVGGRDGAGGTLRLRIDCRDFCPPYNDNIASAEYLYATSWSTRETRGATLEPGEPQPCGNIGKTVWFNLPGGAGEYHLDAGTSDFPAVIAVYGWEGFSPPGGMQNIACSTTGSLDLETRDGFGYLVQVGGIDGAGGTLNLETTCDTRCPAVSFPAPDTGGQGGGVPGGTVTGPDTGSGGYLPGARRPD